MRHDFSAWEIEHSQGMGAAFSLRGIIRNYLYSFLLVVSCCIGGVILAFSAFLNATQVYQATGTFLVDELPFVQTIKQKDAETDRQLVQTLILSIANRDMRIALEKRFNLAMGRIAFAGLDRPIKLQGRQPEANVQVSLIKNSRMGSIIVDSQNPEFAAMIVNGILSELELYNVIGGRLKAIQTSAGFSKALADNMIQQLTDVGAQRIRLGRQLAEMENFQKQNFPLSSYPAFAKDDTLNNLKTQLILVESEYESLASTSTRGARLEGKAAELRMLRSQLAAQADHLAEALRAEYAVSEAQEQALQANKLKAAERLEAFSQESTRLAQSFSDPALMRTLASEKAKDGEAGIANMVVVVNRASPPVRPQRPQLVLYLVLGGALGGIIGLGLAALFVLLDNSLKSSQQIETLLGIPCLAVLSKPKRTPPGNGDERVLNYSHCPAGVGFLRSHLLAKREEKKLSIVGFTSAAPGQRSSLLVADLALLLARADQKTLVVDLHFDNPLIAKTLGIEVKSGIDQWLRSEEPILQHLSYAKNHDLAVFSARRKDSALVTDFSRRPLAAEWAALSAEWDFILIDAPFILSDWSLSLSLPARSPLIVTADFKKTKLSLLQQVCSHARGPHWQVEGVVLTGAPGSISV